VPFDPLDPLEELLYPPEEPPLEEPLYPPEEPLYPPEEPLYPVDSLELGVAVVAGALVVQGAPPVVELETSLKAFCWN